MEPSTVMLLPKLSENYICLMCVDSFHSKNEFFNHLGIEHDFLDFLHHKNQSFISTQFDWIRFVNYVRRNKPHDLRQAFYDGEWKTDSLELLYPVLSDDEVLSIDILDFQMRTTATPAPTTISNNSNSNGHEDDITILSPNSHIANYLCLICSCRLASTTEFFLHLTLKHDCLNFLDGKYHSVFSDHFNWIRFVNYVRRNKPSNLREAIASMAWKTDSYDLLYPVLTDDEVLSIDMSELIIPNGNSTDSEYESDGWQEVTVPDSASPEKYICLVCDVNCDSVVGFFRHLTIQHEWVNLLDGEGRSIFNDQYDWIRFVNFVRKTKPTDLRQAFFDMVWKTDSMDLLYPVLTDDEVLSIDIESYLVDNSQNEQVVNGTVLSNGLNAGATGTTYSRELIIERPSQELLRLVEENRTLRAQLNNCKLLLSNMAKEPVRTKSSSRSPDRKSDIIEPNDSSYFGSYGHFEIHGEMINDRIRTDSYVNFILSNSDKYFKDKIILDVGSGSGILSMIASKAGAKHVYGVEAADEIYAASHETLRVNNLLDRITIIHGQAESVELPVKKVDVIISEWMGYFLFFESMLDSVLNIASKYLSPDGYIFPRHYTLHLLGVQCSDKLRQRRLEHWNNVYGYNMPALRRAALSEAHILNLTNEQTPSSPLLFSPNVSLASLQSSFATCSSESGKTTSPITILTSQPYELIDIDLCDMHKQRVYNLTNNSSILCEQNFSLLIQPSNLSTKISGTFKLDAIVGYFNVRFNDAADVKVEFSTSPTAPLTHWKQTLLFLDKPILVKPSDLVTGKITIRRATLDNRGLEITLKINGTMDYPEVKQTYDLLG